MAPMGFPPASGHRLGVRNAFASASDEAKNARATRPECRSVGAERPGLVRGLADPHVVPNSEPRLRSRADLRVGCDGVLDV